MRPSRFGIGRGTLAREKHREKLAPRVRGAGSLCLGHVDALTYQGGDRGRSEPVASDGLCFPFSLFFRFFCSRVQPARVRMPSFPHRVSLTRRNLLWDGKLAQIGENCGGDG